MTSKLSPTTVLRNYFHAKDENRPHLMREAFSETAVLRMHVRTGNIAFPAVSQGLAAITDVLVSKFGATYENVYSFYLERPHTHAPKFSCHWLVGMTEKEGGNVRVGCGRYDWHFGQNPRGLATQLAITIAVMQVLPPGQLASVFEWLAGLSYPWTSASQITASAPGIAALSPVLQYLQTDGQPV